MATLADQHLDPAMQSRNCFVPQKSGLLELTGQVTRYCTVGVINTAAGFGSIILLQSAASFGPFAANAGGYAVGLTVSFLLNRAWTFRVHGRTSAHVLLFGIAFAVAYLANLATLALLIDEVGPLAAQGAAMGVYSILFFVLCRALVFSNRITGLRQ